MCYCCKNQAKFILLTVNFVILACGGAIVGISYVTKTNSEKMLGILDYIPSSDVEYIGGKEEVASLLDQATTIVMACGSGIMVIALAGFCGALFGSVLLLLFYIIIVTALALVQIAAIVLVVMYSNKIVDMLEPYLNLTISEHYDGGEFDSDGKYQRNGTIALLWDTTMVMYQCCGNMNYMDFQLYATEWKGNVDVNDTSVVPLSCCKITDSTRYNFPKKVEFVNSEDCLMRASSQSTNQQGCYSKLLDAVTKYTDAILYSCVAMISVQLIAIISACVLIYFRCQQENKVQGHPD